MNIVHAGITVLLIGISELISRRTGITVAVIVLISGAIAGNVSGSGAFDLLAPVAWVGALLLVFIAGTEINVAFIRDEAALVLKIGVSLFTSSVFAVFALTRYLLMWPFETSLLCALILSGTSVAIPYAVLRENGLIARREGKLILMSAYFPNILLMISVLFIFKWTVSSTLVLAVFILGIICSEKLVRMPELYHKMRSVAFASVIPIFFFNAGVQFDLNVAVDPISILFISSVLVITRLGVVKIIGGRIFGGHTRLAAGLLNTHLTFEVIVLSVAEYLGVVSAHTYALIMAVLIVTTLIGIVISGRVPRVDNDEFA